VQEFAYSPELWHQPRLADMTCAWSGRLRGINSAIISDGIYDRPTWFCAHGKASEKLTSIQFWDYKCKHTSTIPHVSIAWWSIMHKACISLHFDITNGHESLKKTIKTCIITFYEPTYIRVAPRPNPKEVSNVSAAYCAWRIQFVIWRCLLHETIMYVELGKRVFKAFESMLKEVVVV
jgi:hypothetical protein